MSGKVLKKKKTTNGGKCDNMTKMKDTVCKQCFNAYETRLLSQKAVKCLNKVHIKCI